MSFYALTREVWNGRQAPVDKAEALALIAADRALEALHDIEEAFAVMLANYLDFERLIFSVAVDDMVHERPFRLHLDSTRRDCHRLVTSFAASGRVFVDLADHSLKIIGAAQRKAVKAACSREFDTNFHYRLLYDMRNHTAHLGRAVSGIRFAWERPTQTDKGYRTNHSVGAFISADALEANDKIKPERLAEVRAHMREHKAQGIDLVPAVRSYVGSLNRIVQVVRKETAPLVNECERLIRAGYARMDPVDADLSGLRIGLAVATYEDAGLKIRCGKRIIVEDEAERIRGLQALNPARLDLDGARITL